MEDEQDGLPAPEKTELELKYAELTDCQYALRRTQAQVEFLGTQLASMVERYHGLRVSHGDANAAIGFAQIQQHIEGINNQLQQLAKAEIQE